MPEEPPRPSDDAYLISRIHLAAQIAHLTTAELAAASGVSYNTVTRVLAGTRNLTPDNLARISGALGISEARLRGTGTLTQDPGAHRPGACTARREIARVGPVIAALTCDILPPGRARHRGLHHDPSGVVWAEDEDYAENLARAGVALAELGRPVTTRALVRFLTPGPGSGTPGPSGVLRVHTDPEQDFDTYGREAGQHASDRARQWQRGE